MKAVAGAWLHFHLFAVEMFTDIEPVENRGVWEGRLATTQGPETAFEFAFAPISRHDGAGKAEGLRQAMDP